MAWECLAKLEVPSLSIDEEWEKLEREIATCSKCRLHATRKNAVPGEGNRKSVVMFIGEAPGEREDEMGRPFVGAAGKLLTELIELMGYKREDFYITNVVKCRPPGNRDPEEDEISACLPYLIRQIQLLKPKVIVALGRHAARTIFNLAGLKWSSMTSQHGKVYSARLLGLDVKIVPTYHPASALYKPPLRKDLERDFVEVIKPTISEALSPSPRKPKTLLDFAAETRSSKRDKN
ncbi:MAG: type-4 uracil-DNA glycosylase [Desulfurococcaceae archaeon]|jgi:DNA polymerase